MKKNDTYDEETPRNTREIGTRMQHIRTISGLRQKQVADRLQVSFSHYSKVEVGINKASTKMIRRFCDEFNVDFDWLTTGEGKPFQSVNEPMAAYGNALLAPSAEKQQRRLDDILSQAADIITAMLSEITISQIQKSADDLHMPMKQLLHAMIKDRLTEEFKRDK